MSRRRPSEFTDKLSNEKRFNGQIVSQEGDANDSKDHMLQPIPGNDNSMASHSNTPLEYDPLACPPDFGKARRHGIARRVARIDMVNAKEADQDYCEDCGLPAKNELLPVCGSRLDLADLGPGFPLYYEYVFFTGVLLLLLFGIVGVYNLIKNWNGEDCSAKKYDPDYPCNGGFIMLLSLGNRSADADYTVTEILNLAFVVVAILVCFYYRRIQSMTAEEVNRGAITSADYAVIVTGIPESETPEKIKKFFEDKGRPGMKTCVKKVVCAYEIGTYVEMVKQRAKLAAKRGKSNEPENIEEELRLLEDKLQAFEDAVANNTSQKFTGIAFVSFNTEKEAKGVIEKFKMTGFERMVYSFFTCLLSWLGIKFDRTYNGKLIEVDRAPEPFDVFWENLGYDPWQVAKKRFITLLSSVILVVLSFGAILGISYLQEMIKNKTENDFALVTLLSLLSSYLVTFINSLIGLFMRGLADFEKHSTYTYYFTSIASKLSYAQFFNTALITFIVQIYRGLDDFRLWTADSIVSKAFFLFVLNAIVPSLTYIVNPLYFWKLYQRMRAKSQGQSCKLTQQAANTLFEGPAFDIAQRYANIQKTILFTGFYATLIPIGIPISFVGLILTYWTDKYMLLRRHCKPNALGKELSEEMADFLELFIVSFMCGHLAFAKIVRDDISLLTIIGTALAVAAYILPQKYMSKCIRVRDDDTSNVKTYDEVKYYFLTEYDRANPVTQEEAMKEWFVELAKLDESPENPNNATQTDDKANPFAFFKQLPKDGALNTLLNLGQSNPRHHMNPNTNFNHHIPVRHAGNGPVPMQFMPRQQYGVYPMQQGRFVNPSMNVFMNNLQQVLGNKLVRGQQPVLMQQKPNPFMQSAPKPIIASHTPQEGVSQPEQLPLQLQQLLFQQPQSNRGSQRVIPRSQVVVPQQSGFNPIQPQPRIMPVTYDQPRVSQISPMQQMKLNQQGFTPLQITKQDLRPPSLMEMQMMQQGMMQQQPQRTPGSSIVMQTNMSGSNSLHQVQNQRNGQPTSFSSGSMANQFDSGIKNFGNKFNGFGF